MKEYLSFLKEKNPEAFIQAINIFLALKNDTSTGTKDFAGLAAKEDVLKQKKNVEAALATYYLDRPAAATAFSATFAYQFEQVKKSFEEGKDTPEFQEKLLDSMDAQAQILEMALPEIYEQQKIAFARSFMKET